MGEEKIERIEVQNRKGTDKRILFAGAGSKRGWVTRAREVLSTYGVVVGTGK